MCGRYVVAYDPQTLVAGFSLTRIQPFERRWNIAPTSAVPVVYQTKEGERVGELMRWGLVPHWARDTSIGTKLNNARSEGMADKPSFRQAVRRRRCLLPASGFYEWQPTLDAAGKPAGKPTGKPTKQPWYISPRDAPFMAFAGLFEAWRAPGSDTNADWLLTCCIITTAANALMAPIHDRMPVMLPPEHWAAWLARDQHDPAALAPLMHGLPEGALQAWPVGRAVGRASNEGQALAEPISLLPSTPVSDKD